jgi:kynurenine 3-monooxygenase
VELAGATGRIDLAFDRRIRDIAWQGGRVGIAFERDAAFRDAGDALIAADGAHSAVRARLRERTGGEVSIEPAGYAYKELSLPATPGGDWTLDPQGAHIWPRGRVMMAAFPNPDRTFDCSLFLPAEGPDSFAAIRSDVDVRALFERHFADLAPHFDSCVAQYARHRPQALETIRCTPWHDGGSTVLVGDAAHTVLPFYGQGMNAGFEDCRLLVECLDGCDGDRSAAFHAFDRLRKPDADALADLSEDHFVELRDRASDRAFLALRRLEHALSLRFPDRITPLYARVVFSQTPYAAAREMDRRQAARIEALSAIPGLAAALERGVLPPPIERQALRILADLPCLAQAV